MRRQARIRRSGSQRYRVKRLTISRQAFERASEPTSKVVSFFQRGLTRLKEPVRGELVAMCAPPLYGLSDRSSELTRSGSGTTKRESIIFAPSTSGFSIPCDLYHAI